VPGGAAGRGGAEPVGIDQAPIGRELGGLRPQPTRGEQLVQMLRPADPDRDLPDRRDLERDPKR
jgi:hypothetical protein